jgi:hypothetical protein
MAESTKLRVTRMVYVASFLLTTVLLAALSLKQPLASNIAGGFLWGAFLVLGTMAISRCTGKRRRYLRFFLVVAIVNVIVVPTEVYLRQTGFRYEANIQFGYPRPYQLTSAERDPELFWTFPKSRPGINSYGFEGPEPKRPKSAGTYRIVFLGNTCTYQGLPAMTELILRETDPAVECLNFANPGYSSYQGKVFARTYLAELQPDLVVVSFGWNDRWLAYGAPDAEKKMDASGGAGSDFRERVYASVRLLQLGRKALTPILGESRPLDVSRVPLASFTANLEAIGAVADSLGIPAVFATEPSSHPSLGVPDDVVTSGFARSKESSLDLLRSYNDAVRAVARERRSRHLVDLDSLVSGRSDVRRIFMGDGILYSKAGAALIADIEAGYIRDDILRPHGR